MPEFSRRQFLKISSLLFAGTGATLLSNRAMAHGKFPGEAMGEGQEDELVAGKIVQIDPTGLVHVLSANTKVSIDESANFLETPFISSIRIYKSVLSLR